MNSEFNQANQGARAMKPFLIIAGLLLSLSLATIAAVLLWYRHEGWGWFLVVALITMVPTVDLLYKYVLTKEK